MKARLFMSDKDSVSVTDSPKIFEDEQMLFRLEKISYSYNDTIRALVDVSFEIRPEERFAIIGANGAGKSTLLKIMAGLLYPASGKVFFKGQPVTEQTLRNIDFLRKFRGAVGFVFQDSDVQLFSETVFDELIYGPLQLGLSKDEAETRAVEIMNMLEIAELRDRPPYMLSDGEKKRVALGAVLTMNPEILILDEPTVGLDPRTECFLMELLVFLNSQTKKTIIIATHDLSIVAELQARVAVLSEDHRIEKIGTAEEILNDGKLLLSVNLIHEHLHYHGKTMHRHLHAHTFFHKH
jgi:cobalt/nickel transport system ATP-binding protein